MKRTRRVAGPFLQADADEPDYFAAAAFTPACSAS
jgi:hypothetical protein